MKKNLSLLVIVFFSLCLFLGCDNILPTKLCFKNTCIKVTIAQTPKQRSQGLMYRKNLAFDRGMLFILKKEGRTSMWMRNMRFPLDFIWLDSQKKVVDIYKGALPCKDICKSIFSNQETAYCLEVNAGFVDKFNVQVGDSLSW